MSRATAPARRSPETHPEFIAAVRRNALWSIRQPAIAYRLAFGVVGVLLERLFLFVPITLPTLHVGYVALRQRNPWILLWIPLALAAAIGGRDRTVFGAIPVVVGFVVAGPLVFAHGIPLLAAAAAVPVAWSLSLLIRLAITAAFLKRLTRDADAWQRVQHRDLLRLDYDRPANE